MKQSPHGNPNIPSVKDIRWVLQEGMYVTFGRFSDEQKGHNTLFSLNISVFFVI